MRPIKLILTAFGPYKDKEVIDFSQLAEHNLFVISGKTGSGKTTIFDGISFALYGSASGEDRDNVFMLRSQFADDDLHTAVEFIFALKGRKYRVLRQVGHVKKGNKTKTGEKYEFFEQTDQGEVPRVDRQIVSEINKKIEELIGLTQDQFKQIVMLPQGEFRKFLTSETENKEAILRRLFKTEPYQAIEGKLKEKQRQLKEVYDKDAYKLETLTENITATLPEREESDLLHLLEKNNYNTYQILKGLSSEHDHYIKQIKTNEENYEKASKKYEKKFTALNKAITTNEKFKERLEKLKEKEAFEKKAREQAEKKAELKNAERASKIVPYEMQLNETKKDLHDKEAALYEIKQLNKNNKLSFKEAKTRYQQEKEKEPERDKVKSELDELNRYIPIVKEINNLKREIDEEKKDVLKANHQLTDLQKTQVNNEELLENTITGIEEISHLIQSLPKKEQLKKELLEDWKKLNEYEKTLTRLDALELKLKESTLSYQKKNDAYEREEKKWLNNEAAVLANQLHDGEACQVCGSKTHPDKAVHQADVLSKDDLDHLKQEREKQQSSVQKLTYEKSYEQKKADEAKQNLESLGYKPDQVTEEKEKTKIKGTNLAAEIKQLKDQENKQKTLIDKRTLLREENKRAKETIEHLSKKVEANQLKYTEKKATYNTKLASIPDVYHDLQIVEKQLVKLDQLKIKLDAEWLEAEKNLKKAENDYLTSSTQFEQVEKQVTEANERLNKANKTFNEVLKASQFTSFEKYEVAKLTEAVLNELKETIEQYEKAYQQINHELDQLNKDLENETEVNLDFLEDEVKELKEKSQSSYDEFIHSKNVLKKINELNAAIKEVYESLHENEQALKVLTDLYDVTRGHNVQKISFERYLQIDYLEQIIQAANMRLVDLSNGQYNLILSERQETHGRQSGLAIDVNDAYTGQTRDVKTLSGGEKFNASLALALGMSDVIQSFEGNISIEMMFIDEGFGSLDEESLTKSIDALIDLQKSGRLIGVISHVEELKAVFPATLEVEKTKEGYSKTQFKLK